MEPAASDREKRRDALADLARLQREGDALGGALSRAGEHFSATDAPGDDPIEKWGRRIGRVLGAFAFLALCAYLYFTHVR